MPATMHADMPAIEIAFGETFRAASHAVASCAHFRFRVAIGRRSPSSAADLSIVGLKSIAGPENNDQMTTRERVAQLLKAWPKIYPRAHCELDFRNPLQLLVATILSAQATDKRVNMVTPALFKKYPNAKALAKASTADLERQIVSTGFFRQKSKALIGMATALVADHGGDVPADMDALVKLPGVGRKTANVVLGHALGVPGLPVDRHVLRVANRIGIARSEDPEVVEQQLCDAMPPAKWTVTSDTLILHGRRI